MSRAHLLIVPFLACALLAAGDAAAVFGAAEQLFVPVVAHNAGLEGSLWRSDVTITNVDTTPVDLALVFLPSGLTSNGYLFSSRSYFLGGRAAEGFGKVDEQLADVAVGETVVLPDILAAYWQDELPASGSGGLVIFAYEAGTLDAVDGRVPRNVVVSSRTYNETTIWVPDEDTEGEFVEQEATYGQLIPGVPWYELGDAGTNTVNGDFSFQVLNLVVTDSNYRYNVGILNTSDQQTGITFSIKPYDLAGQPFLRTDESEVALIATVPPLGHLQYSNVVWGAFGLDTEEDRVGRIEIKVIQWTTNSIDPKPRFTTYGSLVDDRTNDPTTVLPSFVAPFDVDCMWEAEPNDDKTAAGGSRRRASQPPLELPSR